MNIKAAHLAYDSVSALLPAKNKVAPEKLEEQEVGGYGALKDVSSWRVFYPEINEDKCISCKTCWLVCPEAALEWKENQKPAMITRSCKGCGVCANECPVKAIEMKRVEITK
jgi:pyruvate ferredoxin oxidoreductase delta subunit